MVLWKKGTVNECFFMKIDGYSLKEHMSYSNQLSIMAPFVLTPICSLVRFADSWQMTTDL